MIKEIFMPKLTHDMKSGLFVRWLKHEGDFVQKGEALFEVETDKAVSEVSSEDEGYLKLIGLKEGQEVKIGGVIAFLTSEENEQPGDQSPPGAEVPAKEIQKNENKKDTLPVSDNLSFSNAKEGKRISPIAKRIAAEKGVDISSVVGSGPNGRIVEKDILKFLVEHNLSVKEVDDGEALGGFTDMELDRRTRQMAVQMTKSCSTIPQFTVEMDVQWNEIEKKRTDWSGKKISQTAVVVRAVALALQNYGLLNAAHLDENHVRIYQHQHIGIALQAPNGLFVPVIHFAEDKNALQIQEIVDRYKQKSGSGDFSIQDLQGGTFTISNLGMYGVDRFTAIILPPQSAILAIGRISEKPTRIKDGIRFSLFATLRLTADHRFITGAYASQFLMELKTMLERPEAIFERRSEKEP